MSRQSFSEESNWKHEPHSEHYVDDKFGEGTDTRNWVKNLDKKSDNDLKAMEDQEESSEESESQDLATDEQEDDENSKKEETVENKNQAISQAGRRRQEGNRYQ